MNKLPKALLLSSLLLPTSLLISSEIKSVNAESFMEVTSNSLNVRSESNSSSPVIDWLEKGQVVKVIQNGNGWDYIEFENGKRGYVSDSYLKAASQTNYKVNTYSLTVRSGAGVSFKAIDYLSKNTVVTIISNSSNGWAKISYDNKTGYVNSSYLSKTAATTSTTKASSPSTSVNTAKTKSISYVSASTLTLRNGASVDYKAIGYLPKNTEVEILSYHKNWIKVLVTKTGKTGYVNGNYVTKPIKVNAEVSTVVPGTITDVSNNKEDVKGTYAVTKYVSATDGLNLRNGRGVSNSILLNIPYGTTISISDIQNGWGKVSYKGKTGYLNVSYTSNTKPAAVSKPAAPSIISNDLKGKLIVLDPGHGGKFAGAQGFVHEEDVNLAIATKTKRALEAMGAVVVMTRTSDNACNAASYNADLLCRPGIATKLKADAFISIHANSGAASAYGAETFYYNTSRGDKVLANDILKEIVEEAGMRSRRVAYGNFAVIRNSTVPSVLVETGFVTNSSDAAKLGSATYQEKFAKAISEGINKFFN